MDVMMTMDQMVRLCHIVHEQRPDYFPWDDSPSIHDVAYHFGAKEVTAWPQCRGYVLRFATSQQAVEFKLKWL